MSSPLKTNGTNGTLAEATAKEAGAVDPEKVADASMIAKAAAYRPFPVEMLPEPMQSLVLEGAQAIGVDPAMIALPALAVAASAIGSSRAIEIKPGWAERATLWTCVIARSGSGKSPAAQLALAPLRDAQAIACQQFEKKTKDHRVRELEYKREMRAWERADDAGDPPAEPEAPLCERVLVGDVTVEALAPILAANPRGLLLSADELAAWLKSFGAYKSGRGGDAESWLSIFDSTPILIDRKTAGSVYVASPHVSITGTIQPGTLRRALSDSMFESGLAARLLIAEPPARSPKYSDASVSAATRERWAACVAKLRSLAPGVIDDGEPRPLVSRMSRAAQFEWITLHDELAERIEESDDRGAAALSKLRAYSARLSMIVQLVREAGLDAALDTPAEIAAESARAGCDLARWFAREAERIVGRLDDEDSDAPAAAQRRLLRWVQSRGGRVDARQLAQSGPRTWRGEMERAKAALDGLRLSGYGRWVYPSQRGRPGRPSREQFVLESLDTELETRADDAGAGVCDSASEGGRE